MPLTLTSTTFQIPYSLLSNYSISQILRDWQRRTTNNEMNPDSERNYASFMHFGIGTAFCASAKPRAVAISGRGRQE
jgi:hypothetical protein